MCKYQIIYSYKKQDIYLKVILQFLPNLQRFFEGLEETEV